MMLLQTNTMMMNLKSIIMMKSTMTKTIMKKIGYQISLRISFLRSIGEKSTLGIQIWMRMSIMT